MKRIGAAARGVRNGLAAGLVLVIAAMPVSAPLRAGETAQASEAPRLGPVTRRPLPRYVSLKAKANVRRGPGTDQRIDWVFRHRGMPLQVIAEFGNWRKVVDADGTGGWIHHFFLRNQRTVVVRAPRTSLREAPDAQAREVARAMQGVIARVRECGADWCLIAVDGYEGWVIKRDVWGVDPGEILD